jgi:hypothetical protein
MKSWRKVWWIAFHIGYWEGHHQGYREGWEEKQEQRADYDAEIMAGIQYDIWRERTLALKEKPILGDRCFGVIHNPTPRRTRDH